MKQFKARPAPSFKNTNIFQFSTNNNNNDNNTSFEKTKFEPFNLRTEERGSLAEKLLHEKLEREKLKEEENRKFKAKDILVVEEPFVSEILI